MDKGDQGRRLSDRGRRRLTTVIILSVVVILLMLSLIAQSGFNLSPILSPNTAGETLLLYGLSSLNFLAFITLFFVLLRNVLKLVRERRAGRLGSKFKARLVIYALGLSLLPVLLLFFFSFGLINRSIDRWFGEPTRQIVDDSHILEDSYFKREQRELISVARAVAQGLSLKPETDYASPVLAAAVKQQMANYDLALVRLVKGDNRVTIQNGNVEPDIEDTLKQGEIDLKGGGAYFEGKDDGASPSIIYAIAAVRVMTPDGPAEVSDPPGAGVPRPAPAAGTNLDQAPILILAREFPRAANIDEHYSKIDNLRKKLKPVKDIQILLLALVTLLLLFSAVWVALHLARGITVPIQALAEATSRVARGDFSHPI
ncbi:MAG TPA: hypothetical protein VJX67_09330, partial [Blastocatellia bacterium]|nr:hypothetical protein [Blastocatellia bacterium]